MPTAKRRLPKHRSAPTTNVCSASSRRIVRVCMDVPVVSVAMWVAPATTTATMTPKETSFAFQNAVCSVPKMAIVARVTSVTPQPTRARSKPSAPKTLTARRRLPIVLLL